MRKPTLKTSEDINVDVYYVPTHTHTHTHILT